MMQNTPDIKNLVVAIALSAAILLLWQFFYEQPQREKALHAAAEIKKQEKTLAAAKTTVTADGAEGADMNAPRESLLQKSPRVRINSPALHGSVALLGLKFDDITLARYRETADPASKEVVLLSPYGNKSAYVAEFGWVSETPGVKLPDASSLWQADAAEISPGRPVTFRWENGQGQRFFVTVTLDERYMFTLRQRVENAGGAPVVLRTYGFLNRNYATQDQNMLLHEGVVAVFDNALTELHYSNLMDEGGKSFAAASGWLGLSDKYWLTALVPDAASSFTANVKHYRKQSLDRYQTDFLSGASTLAPGAAAEATHHFFAGAKEVAALDAYGQKLGIPLFDRAVDFGSLYFLTKPIFLTLAWFYQHIGNFGIAILLLTVVIKALMFPLANKSYAAMNQMKRLQPEMTRLREAYGNDKMRFNQELMQLYKREKANPMAGCLPIIIQLPVFFALYKVLYVSIEMRHAPFFGWVHDLSAPDPTNVFTLFGLVPWSPPSLLHIGLWPLIMCATMVVQQLLNPKPTDPVQAKMMAALPYIFLFLFASFPAGLVIYWAWSNLLSILQQWIIMHRMRLREAKAAA